MCGLVGMAGLLDSKKYGKMFHDMIIFDVVRGGDSTGVAAVGDSDKIIIEKDIGSPQNLWEFKTSKIFNFDGVFRGGKRVLIGHNRFATTGAVNVENAHPFEYDHITGAHNGTLTDWCDLEGYSFNGVDSKSIFKTIAAKGIDHCWKSFRGAAAISYWDNKNHTLNLIRNKDRPLNICMSRDGKTLFWASEAWMINISAMRSNIELELKENEETTNTILLKEDFLHVYNVGLNNISLKEVRELEKKPFPKYYQNLTASTGFKGGATSGRFKNMKDRINFGWASGLLKGGKNFRGLKLALNYGIKPYNEHSNDHWIIVANLLNDKDQVVRNTRVEIMANTVEEYLDWDKRTKNALAVWKINSRPRLTETLGYLHSQVVLRVSSKEVSFSHDREKVPAVETDPDISILMAEAFKSLEEYGALEKPVNNDNTNVITLKGERKYLGGNGKYVLESTWWKELCEIDAHCSCTSCGNPISTEDHMDLLWLRKAVICKSCQEDQTIMEWVRYN